jgi:hypothetical protein
MIVIKNAGVYDFKFRVLPGSAAIFFKELCIRKRGVGDILYNIFMCEWMGVSSG